MESQKLQTASSYINNLLLSRGLLRNGVPIEFATPSKVEGGVDGTMAKVMNLVHDLILRRDVSSYSELNHVHQNGIKLISLWFSEKPKPFLPSHKVFKHCEHRPTNNLK